MSDFIAAFRCRNVSEIKYIEKILFEKGYYWGDVKSNYNLSIDFINEKFIDMVIYIQSRKYQLQWDRFKDNKCYNVVDIKNMMRKEKFKKLYEN